MDGLPASVHGPTRTQGAARKAKLSDEVIAGLRPEPRKYYVWDLKNSGLGVRIGVTGLVAFVLKVNLPGRRSKWITLKAKTFLEAVKEYHLKLADYGKEVLAPEHRADKLWQDVVDDFETEHLQTVKSTTASTYRSALKHIREAFRDRFPRGIGYQDLWKFHRSMEENPRQANVCIRLSGMIFDRCELWGLRDRGTNPLDDLRRAKWKPYPEDRREVELSDDYLEKLGGALERMEASGKESPYPIAAVRLLFFLGRRKREVLDLEWTQIDLKTRTIRWKDTKTGAASAPLNDAAWEVIKSLDRIEGNPYLLPGEGRKAPKGQPRKPAPIQDITKFWNRLLKEAGITTVTDRNGIERRPYRHDLRHAHGDTAAGLNMSQSAIAALLGHSQTSTTDRYSKPRTDKRLEASNTVAGDLKGKLRGKR